MEPEARRLILTAGYESEIQQIIERMASQEIIDEIEYEDERSDTLSLWEDDSPEESQQATRLSLAPLEATTEWNKSNRSFEHHLAWSAYWNAMLTLTGL